MALIHRPAGLLGPHAQPPAPSLSEVFHENTKLHPDAPVGGRFPTTYSYDETEAMVSAGRRYHRCEQVSLPAQDPPLEPGSFEAIVASRRTSRQFDPAPVSVNTLTRLLEMTYGVTDRQRLEGGLVRELRSAPSAGALYPIEIYLGARNVQGLPSGLYHYAPRPRTLERLLDGDPTARLATACYYRESLEQSAIVVILAGVFDRTRRKYGERGYRYVLLEAGHVAQNVCLASERLGLGCMNVCGFYDDVLNGILNLDGVDEAALYVAYIGGRSVAEGDVNR